MIIKDQSADLTISDKTMSGTRYPDGREGAEETEVVREHLLDLYVNERLAVRILCTPSHLKELVAGRLISEGYIRSADEIRELYICRNASRAKVFLTDVRDPESDPRDLATDARDQQTNTRGREPDAHDPDKNVRDPETDARSLQYEVRQELSCCTDNQTFLTNRANRELTPLKPSVWQPEDIFSLAKTAVEDTRLHRMTCGTHACYLSHRGTIVFQSDDIGRHNALDKVIGYICLHALDPADCMVFSTGRIPTDMLRKVIRAGIPVLVSKSVPTREAIDMAEHYNLTLICKAWPDRFEVFHAAKS